MNEVEVSAVPTAVESPLFPGRTYLPQYVPWMTVRYPAVTGPEYRRFRKAHGGLTHHDYTVDQAAAHFKSGTPERAAIVSWLAETYVRRSWTAEHGTEIQVAQFLAQLTQRGWNGLINEVLKVLSGRPA